MPDQYAFLLYPRETHVVVSESSIDMPLLLVRGYVHGTTHSPARTRSRTDDSDPSSILDNQTLLEWIETSSVPRRDLRNSSASVEVVRISEQPPDWLLRSSFSPLMLQRLREVWYGGLVVERCGRMR